MSEAPHNPKPRKPKRRFFRFGLKALLFFTAVIAVWLGIITNRANRQRRAVEAISELGGEFSYDYQRVPDHEQTMGYGFSSEAKPPGPEWLHSIVGYDYFVKPVKLTVERQAVVDEDRLAYLADLPDIDVLSIDGVKLRNEDLGYFRHLTKLQYLRLGEGTLSNIDGADYFDFLSRCPKLQVLSLRSSHFGSDAAAHLSRATHARILFLYDTAIGDEGLAHFKDMSNLEMLGLSRTRIGDAGLAHLKPLAKLTYLSINDTQVTDAGLQHLKSLISLQAVELFDTKVTAQGLSDLKAALPNCKVTP